MMMSVQMVFLLYNEVVLIAVVHRDAAPCENNCVHPITFSIIMKYRK
jgi:hypothetical protein